VPYEVDLRIKGRKFTHPVNVIKEPNDNIIGINFMHLHKLTYNVHTPQVIFANTYPNTMCTTKQVTVPAMTSSILNAKFNGEIHKNKTYIGNIHCPSNPAISGMPAIVSMDSNNNCKVIMENCAPDDMTIEMNDLMGIIEIEAEKLIPLTDHAISSVCTGIHAKLPKIQKPRISQHEIARQCHLQVPNEFREQYINILFNHQESISIDKYNLGLARNYKHKIHLKNTDPVYRKQFKILAAHHQFIEQTLEE